MWPLVYGEYPALMPCRAVQMRDAAFTARSMSDDSRAWSPAAQAAWALGPAHPSRRTSKRGHPAGDTDFLPLELALQWAGISLRNRTPAQVWTIE